MSSSVVLQFWQYNSSAEEQEEEEVEDKEHEKTCFAVFPTCCVEIHLFMVNLFFLYVLDINVTRNGILSTVCRLTVIP